MNRPILSRTVDLSDQGQSARIEVDQPTLVSAHEYRCEWRIIPSYGSPYHEKVTGADEIQAVMIAFDAVAAKLRSSYAGATWMGLPLDIAFPRPIPYVAGLDTYREIEDFADQLLSKKFG